MRGKIKDQMKVLTIRATVLQQDALLSASDEHSAMANKSGFWGACSVLGISKLPLFPYF